MQHAAPKYAQGKPFSAKVARAAKVLAIFVTIPVSLPVMAFKYYRRGYPLSSIIFKKRRTPRKNCDVRLLGRYLWSARSAEVILRLEELRRTQNFRSLSYRQACQELAVWFDSRHEHTKAFDILAPVTATNAAEEIGFGLLKCQLLQKAGRDEDAKQGLAALRPWERNTNLYLVRSNCEKDIPEKIRLLNRIYESRGISQIAVGPDRDLPVLGALTGTVEANTVGGWGKVSVIFPVFNAEDTIDASVGSVLDQTYGDLELILIDDRSTDGTLSRLHRLADLDSRIVVREADRNAGAYAARNMGLRIATGDFVTTHDADDWSHPEKIERHLRAFRETPSLQAVGSHWARMTEGMQFTAWSLTPQLIRRSYPSFMVRKPVFEHLGEWDPVRISGDAEFMYRVGQSYGRDRVAWIEGDVPLSFSLALESSLTNMKSTHVSSTRHGLRRYYHEIFKLQWREAPAAGRSAQIERLGLVPPEILGHRSDDKRYALSLVGDCRSQKVISEMRKLRQKATGPIAVTHVPEITPFAGLPDMFCDDFLALIRDPDLTIAHDPHQIDAARQIALAG